MLSNKVLKRKNFTIPKHHDRWILTYEKDLNSTLLDEDIEQIDRKVEAIKMLRFFYKNIDDEYSTKRLNALKDVPLAFKNQLDIEVEGFIVCGSTSLWLSVPSSDLELYIICSRKCMSNLGYRENDKSLDVTPNSKGDFHLLQIKINDFMLPIMKNNIDVFLLGLINSDELSSSEFEKARLAAAYLTGIATLDIESEVSLWLKSKKIKRLTYELLKLHFNADICNGYKFSLLTKYPSRIGYKFDELPKDIQQHSFIIVKPI